MISKARLFINTSFLLAILLMIASSLSAQPDNSRQIDSLKVLFPKQEGVEKIESLYELSYLISDTDLDSAIYYDSLALKKAKQIKDIKRQAKILSELGYYYCRKFDYVKAKILLEEALKFCQVNDLIYERFIAYSNLGNYHFELSQYDSALQYQYCGRKIAYKMGEKCHIAISYNNLGLIYLSMKDYHNSLKFFKKSLEFNLQNSDSLLASTNYLNLGLVYYSINEFELAEKSLKKALNTISNQHQYKTLVYIGLGQLYMRRSKFEDARNSFLLSIESNSKTKDKKLGGLNFLYLAQLEMKSNSNDSSVYYLSKSYQLFSELESKLYLSFVLNTYSQFYEKIGQFDSAYYYHKKYIALKDSIFTPNLTHNLTNLQLAYQAEESQQVIEEKEQRLTQTTKYLWLAGMVLLICVVQLFRFYHRFL